MGKNKWTTTTRRIVNFIFVAVTINCVQLESTGNSTETNCSFFFEIPIPLNYQTGQTSFHIVALLKTLGIATKSNPVRKSWSLKVGRFGINLFPLNQLDLFNGLNLIKSRFLFHMQFVNREKL